jgi:hypothetical protein
MHPLSMTPHLGIFASKQEVEQLKKLRDALSKSQAETVSRCSLDLSHGVTIPLLIRIRRLVAIYRRGSLNRSRKPSRSSDQQISDGRPMRRERPEAERHERFIR